MTSSEHKHNTLFELSTWEWEKQQVTDIIHSIHPQTPCLYGTTVNLSSFSYKGYFRADVQGSNGAGYFYTDCTVTVFLAGSSYYCRPPLKWRS